MVVSVELIFARALADNIEILFLGERSSIFYVTSGRKVTKTLLLPTLLMDSDEIVSMINKCPHLKFKFRGVFAADLFPILKSNCFIIVNASESSMPGSHWILLCYHDNNMYFAKPLGLSVTNYTTIYVRLMRYYQNVQELNAKFPLQQRNSELCGLYCIYIAHVIYTKDFKAFIETEFSSSRTAKGTWLVCHGYYFENEPQKIDGQDDRAEDVTARKALVADSLENYFIGKPASDILTCDKQLLSGVTLRISFRRSSNVFAVISEADKHYKVKIIEANLYVRKMTIADHVLSAIKKTLFKTPAVYRYNEVLPRTFLATRDVHSWRQEDVFSKEPVRRMAIAMSSNQAYLGSNRTTPFHYQKFGLLQIVIYRNGFPIVGTPITTNFEKRLYFNTIEALDFLDRGGHGISLSDNQNHFVMVFDFTSTQEASHDFIHPELTNGCFC